MTDRRKKAVFNWSGGKDSALALQKVLHSGDYDVVSLLTTVNGENGRSSMHAIPALLLQEQAASIGIPLHIVELPADGSMGNYESAMSRAVEHFTVMGVRHFIFGDIFLHDVKVYREKQFAPYGIDVVEPLWGKSSEEIMREFIESGLQTVVVTTMADLLDESFIGRYIDGDFLDDLPSGVDVCGENGEYHTFCYAGPIFRRPVPFSIGNPYKMTHPVKLDDGTERDYSYWFANLDAKG
jgi:uncharacterized protein (TIGR00290 family)